VFTLEKENLPCSLIKGERLCHVIYVALLPLVFKKFLSTNTGQMVIKILALPAQKRDVNISLLNVFE
jgi:hypothetical protein